MNHVNVISESVCSICLFVLHCPNPMRVCLSVLSSLSFLGDDSEPRLRERGDCPGCASHRDRGRAGQDHEERRSPPDGLRAVPGKEGARNQKHRPPNARGTSQSHSR